MDSFIFIFAAGFLLSVLLFIWCVVRVASLRGTQDRVERLERELDRLGDRLRLLEKQPAREPLIAERKRQPATVPDRALADAQPSTVPVELPLTPPAFSQPQPMQPANPVPAPPPMRPAPAAAARVPVLPTPHFASPEPLEEANPPRRSISLEERLGQNWLNKLGIVTLVTGLALLLGYQMRTFGPLGKSLMGVLISGAMLVTGLLLERRERYRLFARAAIGGGWALLYFVTFALFHVPAMQVLHSQSIDLVLMFAVAVGMVLHSLRYRSQVVTSLAFLLGFLTVSISHVTLFSLVAGAILSLGLVTVAFRERWFVMVLCGLAAVYLNHFLWLQRVLPKGAQAGHPFPEFLPSAALLLFNWLLFRAFYIFRVPNNDRDRLCATLNVLLNSAGLITLLKYQSSHPEWAFPGLLVLGTAELVLAFVARRRHHNAFVALGCIASLFLLAAVPFHFAGSNWSMVWLLQAETLFIAGLALRESVFRRLGVVSLFATIAHLFVQGALPIFNLRQTSPDTIHHLPLALAFGCSALVAWFNAEYATRRWPGLAQQSVDQNALRVLSYAAVPCAAIAMWLPLAGPWTILPWWVVALALASVADRLRSVDIAQQAELLSFAAIVRGAVINFQQWDQPSHAPRALILLAACGLVYAQMRRRQPSYLLRQKDIAVSYTWTAAAALSALAWYALQPASVAVAWCLLGVALLEIGFTTGKTFFRQQGLVLLASSFVRLFFINIALPAAPRMYTMLPLAAIYAYAYQRVYASDRPSYFDRIFGAASAWFSLGTLTALLYFSVRPTWVSIAGALLSVGVLALARVLRRPLFSLQALVLIGITAARTLTFNILSAEPLSAPFADQRVFTAGLSCAVLLAGLPIAFALRKQQQETSADDPAWLHLVRHPEQVLFFAPLVICFAWIPIQLRAGMITIGWSALGLLTFLFALVVRERSFRLAGLAVLLMGVGKMGAVDIWRAAPMDRYITLIVMGAALLLVSFLYSRYREKILELL